MTDWLSVRGGYRHGFALDGSAYFEDRILAEQTIHVTRASPLVVDLRTREDFRWLNSGFSVRLRERILLQHAVTLWNYAFSPYTSAEIFFDTRYGQFARYRLSLGATLPIDRGISLEPYVARQGDFYPSLSEVNALGLTAILTF